MTCDRWQVTRDTWHMTRDEWHVTCDMWHMTHDTWWTLCQNVGSLALMVWELWCFWRLGGKGLVTHLISDKAVCRTAPATPGLLNINVEPAESLAPKHWDSFCLLYMFRGLQKGQGQKRVIIALNSFAERGDQLCMELVRMSKVPPGPQCF